MDELKPCPFCGGAARCKDNSLWERVYDEGGAVVDVDFTEPCEFWVECQVCNGSGAICRTEEEAVAAWNRRSTIAAREVVYD